MLRWMPGFKKKIPFGVRVRKLKRVIAEINHCEHFLKLCWKY